jgi:hypothetical protein
MCDVQGNHRRPSKHGQGGKALVEAMLVRIQVTNVVTYGFCCQFILQDGFIM